MGNNLEEWDQTWFIFESNSLRRNLSGDDCFNLDDLPTNWDIKNEGKICQQIQVQVPRSVSVKLLKLSTPSYGNAQDPFFLSDLSKENDP